jgi:hypothetical protein
MGGHHTGDGKTANVFRADNVRPRLGCVKGGSSFCKGFQGIPVTVMRTIQPPEGKRRGGENPTAGEPTTAAREPIAAGEAADLGEARCAGEAAPGDGTV